MRTKILFLIFLLLFATGVTFLPSLNNGFTNWDDDRYVSQNPDIRSNIHKIFNKFYVSNYQPVTMLSYALDYRLFGLKPAAYHLTNLFIHLFNCTLLFWLILILSQNIFVAFFTSLLFGIHPLHVESVAWISARKDLLSCLFFLAASISYLYYLKRKTHAYYYFSLLLFILSLLSKAITIVFPFILLLYDNYVHKRVERKDVLEKLPFFEVAAILGLIALHAQHIGGAINYKHLFTFLHNIGIASYAIMFYLSEAFFPVQLSCFYPGPGGLPPLGFVASFIAAVFILGLAIYSLRYTRKLFFGAAFFFMALIPVLQFVPIGQTIVADRYTYIPLIGLFYVIAESLNWVFTKKIQINSVAKLFSAVVLAIPICALSILSWERCGVWKDSITLWSDAIMKHPGEVTSINNRGHAYYLAGDFDKALGDYNNCLNTNPFVAKVYHNRANLFRAKGEYEKAFFDYARAIGLEPQDAENYNERGIAYQLKGDFNKALSDYNEVLRRNPQYANAYNNRGILYRMLGKYDLAIADYNQALSLNPDFAFAYSNRAFAYASKKEYIKAWQDIRKALSLGFKVNQEFIDKVRKEIQPIQQ